MRALNRSQRRALNAAPAVDQPGRIAWAVWNAEDDEDVTHIDIFDVIGDPWFGTDAAEFVKELRDVASSKIVLHINSPGGYVDDALAMYNALLQHPATVEAQVESTAASAASFLAMAADKVLIARTGKFMIHDAWGIGIGNAADMLTLASFLDGESQNIAGIYAEKAGGEADEWREKMKADNGFGTTFRGQAAVDAGLADELMASKRSNLVAHSARLRAVARVQAAGRTMSQSNLDKLHAAISAIADVHSGVCDDEDCELKAENKGGKKHMEETEEEEPEEGATDSAAVRLAATIAGLRR